MRHPFIAEKQHSLLLIIDIQQAMTKVIKQWEAVTRRVNQLSTATGILGIPLLVTEHYKKGLGPTIPELAGATKWITVFHKEHFSNCFGNCCLS